MSESAAVVVVLLLSSELITDSSLITRVAVVSLLVNVCELVLPVLPVVPDGAVPVWLPAEPEVLLALLLSVVVLPADAVVLVVLLPDVLPADAVVLLSDVLLVWLLLDGIAGGVLWLVPEPVLPDVLPDDAVVLLPDELLLVWLSPDGIAGGVLWLVPEPVLLDVLLPVLLSEDVPPGPPEGIEPPGPPDMPLDSVPSVNVRVFPLMLST